MNLLSFYVSEKQHHADMPLYEWVLEEAKSLGVPGGSAFRAIAGFGRHGKMHEDTFFELAGELAIKVEFVVDDMLADQLLDRIHSSNMNIYYLKQKVEAGII
jgi:PII-like signaling protein